MAALDALLVIQQHDTAADRLRHRHATLPERAELVARNADRDRVEVQLADARSRRGEVLAHERRLDDEATSLEAKAKEVERKLYGGTTSNLKELQAMEADVKHLRSRRNELEEQELLVMEQRETLDAEVRGLEEQLAVVEAERTRLAGAISEHEVAIDAELMSEIAARAAAAETLPPALLTTYDSIRTKNKGVGAARLMGDTCQGCRLSLPATEVDRIRHLPADELGRCDNCGAILVRG